MAIAAIALDLDGVIRHFDPDHPADVERIHGLPPGCLSTAAFAPQRIQPLVTGKVTRATWIEQVGVDVGNVDAAAEWLARPGRIDHEVLEIVDALRADGYPVSILTNGTDTVPAELAAARILHRFDALFNTAQIGVAKPDPAVFEHVCRALAVGPGAVFFTDDSSNHIEGATRFGLQARLFRDAAGLRADLSEVLS